MTVDEELAAAKRLLATRVEASRLEDAITELVTARMALGDLLDTLDRNFQKKVLRKMIGRKTLKKYRKIAVQQ